MVKKTFFFEKRLWDLKKKGKFADNAYYIMNM
jgi:hypothetical protein